MACPACGQTPLPPAGARALTVANVLKAAIAEGCRPLPVHHWKILNALLACRTPAMGGHLYQCLDCGRKHFIAHSCRNRHCPSCQKTQALQWLDKQQRDLIPAPYFHVVFTLPHALNKIIEQNQRSLYNLLFHAAAETLLEFGRNRFKAQLGITCVLHTWGQTLIGHYHLHCIVTGGGLSIDGSQWRSAPTGYLFSVKALSRVFKAKFRDGLLELHRKGLLEFHGQLASHATKEKFRGLLVQALRSQWNIYCKRPFAGPRQVLSYLSRYTHRVAIGNGRLVALDNAARTITFRYKDYADSSQKKLISLTLEEFLRRFLLHVLPKGFVKIRHFGLLANHNRIKNISLARELIAAQTLPHPAATSCIQQSPTPEPPPVTCPHCHSRKVVWLAQIARGQTWHEFEDSS